MPLKEYYQKREFSKTPEPKGKVGKEDLNRFVIQRHQATRLHYDLRLEMEGVLKSWAVPKGPSMNPKDKRLAIHTEDHPIEYLTFKGVIPKGNYGAGVMQIWDSGTYEIIESKSGKDAVRQHEQGDLKIKFHGGKIKGNFALVRTPLSKAENSWLLIKKKDQFSTDLEYDAEVFSGELEEEEQKKEVKTIALHPDEFIKPMLATPKKEIFKDPDWLFEIKWDGYRLMANIIDGKVSIFSRNGISYNNKFSVIKEDLEKIHHDCVLDGELVFLDEEGKPDFQGLQFYDTEPHKGKLRYYVFDLLHLNGMDTLSLPLIDRKSFLPEIVENLEHVVISNYVIGMGPALYKKTLDAGYEGVMAKKMDSNYIPGYRTDKWLKIKEVNTEEAIICGVADLEEYSFRSLILGRYNERKLFYMGNCGSGFSGEEQKKLIEKFQNIKMSSSPFSEKINLKGRKPQWLKPELVCEVKFLEWTKEGKMRHPVYKGLREDKEPEEIIPQEAPEKPTEEKENPSKMEVDGVSLSFTNLDKIYWPESGYTKYDLIDYYLHISEYILPFLKDRPQNMHRHPNGIHKESFYQKDNETLPDWVPVFEVYSESSGRKINYLLCQNEATLLFMANLGCIEINPWNSMIDAIEKPSWAVIDIDPSKNNNFSQVKEVALATKEVLDLAGIEGFCKTSGSTGMHIYLPMGGQYSYDEVRDFTKLLCFLIKEKLPDLTTLERMISKRGDRIYLDFLQNRYGQTLAAPYCVRPKPGAPVSAPIEWYEITDQLEILDFNITNMFERLRKKGNIFLPVLGKGLDMSEAIDRLST